MYFISGVNLVASSIGIFSLLGMLVTALQGGLKMSGVHHRGKPLRLDLSCGLRPELSTGFCCSPRWTGSRHLLSQKYDLSRALFGNNFVTGHVLGNRTCNSQQIFRVCQAVSTRWSSYNYELEFTISKAYFGII